MDLELAAAERALEHARRETDAAREAYRATLFGSDAANVAWKALRRARVWENARRQNVERLRGG